MPSKHTPGPWRIERYTDTVVRDGDRIRAANNLIVVNEVWGASLPECDANYKLVAAAPELLEALQFLQKAIHAARLLDVKKRFDLCLADSAASKAIYNAGGFHE